MSSWASPAPPPPARLAGTANTTGSPLCPEHPSFLRVPFSKRCPTCAGAGEGAEAAAKPGAPARKEKCVPLHKANHTSCRHPGADGALGRRAELREAPAGSARLRRGPQAQGRTRGFSRADQTPVLLPPRGHPQPQQLGSTASGTTKHRDPPLPFPCANALLTEGKSDRPERRGTCSRTRGQCAKKRVKRTEKQVPKPDKK